VKRMKKYEIFQAIFTTVSTDKFLSCLRDIANRHGVHIVCFNADLIAGCSHVKAAVEHAQRSVEGGDPIAKTFEMEALLYASGNRQCQDAAQFGLHGGENRCYLCISPPSKKAKIELENMVGFVDENWETIDRKKKTLLLRLFSITPEEMEVVGEERLKDLVLERVALLEVYR
jgi:KEOPS complex subunit Cgi121